MYNDESAVATAMHWRTGATDFRTRLDLVERCACCGGTGRMAGADGLPTTCELCGGERYATRGDNREWLGECAA